MATYFYADPETGRVKGFGGGFKNGQPVSPVIPDGWVEVPPPENGRDVWDFENETYIPYRPEPTPLEAAQAELRRLSLAQRSKYMPIVSSVLLAINPPVGDPDPALVAYELDRAEAMAADSGDALEVEVVGNIKQILGAG